jgi:MIP family channel proteins
VSKLNREATPYLAELIGTFAFVLIAAGAVAVNNQTAGSLGTLGIAIASGLGLMAAIYTFSHISGGYFNPAVTIALWTTKKLEASVAFWYIVSQLFGAVLAGIFIEGFLGGASQVVPELTKPDAVAAVFIEALLTFILVLVIYGTLIDRRSHTSHAGMAIGLVYTALVLIGFNLTGAALNPARVFGPALVDNLWANHLVYWLGPILGAVIAGLVYEYGVLRSKE